MAKYKRHPPAFLRSDVFIFCHGLLHNRGDCHLSQACSKLLSPIYPSLNFDECDSVLLGQGACSLFGYAEGRRTPLQKRRWQLTKGDKKCRRPPPVCVQQTLNSQLKLSYHTALIIGGEPMFFSWGADCALQTPCNPTPDSCNYRYEVSFGSRTSVLVRSLRVQIP